MARKPEAYVDTSALIAFADRSDSDHSLSRRLFEDPPELFTSTLADGVGLHLIRERRTKVCWSTDSRLRLSGVPLVIDQA